MPALANPSTQARPRRGRRWLAGGLLLAAAVYVLNAGWHANKPLPAGLDQAMPYRAVSSVEFLSDSTWLDGQGRRHTERQIFAAALDMVDRAEGLVLADFFLVNQFAGKAGDGHRGWSGELVDALARRPQGLPGQATILITDPFNTLYGGAEQPLFERLDQAGVRVIPTDLAALRDSNPLWSAAWRMCCKWLGNASNDGWLANPVGPEPVTLRTWLALLNFKANHRKTLVAQTEHGWHGLVTSANPHDASSRHDNIALRFEGLAALDLLVSEAAVAAFSGAPIEAPMVEPDNQPGRAVIRVLTESRIRDAALEMIEQARAGERLDLLMFYLSHRAVIEALKRAQARGVRVRVLLDPNRDAFGREKDGVPNRPVAKELHNSKIPVRWCNTSGEQCHAKMLLKYADGEALLLAGSANFTRRNLDGFNLETNVQLRGPIDLPALADALAFFQSRWANEPDRIHSLPYETFADSSPVRYWRYRLMEATGLSTF